MSKKEAVISFVEPKALFAWQRLRPVVDASHDGMTKTEFTDDCDINKIVARFHKTGELPDPKFRPVYTDLTLLPENYHQALDLMNKVADEFNSLSAEERLRYHNDPRNYLSDLEGRQKALSEAQEAIKAEEAEQAVFEASQRKAAREAAKNPPKED